MTRKIFIICIVAFSYCKIGKAQEIIHVSDWQDDFTILKHLPRNLNHLIGQYDYLQRWDTLLNVYKSYIPDGLIYTNAANQTVEIERIETGYLFTDHFQDGWESFTVDKMNRIFSSHNTVENCKLTYNNKGQLILSSSTLKHKRKTQNTDIQFVYSADGINIERQHQIFQLFANYESTDNGHIRGRPLLLKSTWGLLYKFNTAGQLIAAKSQFEQKVNGKKSKTVNNTVAYTFAWDTHGRLTTKNYGKNSDSLTTISTNSYANRPFDYSAEINEFPLLKTPSIERWLKSFNPKELSIVESEINGSKAYTIMHNQSRPLILLNPQKNARQYIWQYIEDSTGIYSEKFEITTLPDSNDTISYDPNFKPFHLGTEISQCSITELYSQPKGMIIAQRAEIYRHTIIPLPNGWRLVKYQTGRDVNVKFAIGHPAPIRLDVIFDEYILLDETGTIKYFLDFNNSYRFYYQK